jgi:hypothetical protein
MVSATDPYCRVLGFLDQTAEQLCKNVTKQRMREVIALNGVLLVKPTVAQLLK